MFKNYLTTAFRNIIRHRLYSAINVIGLAVGLAACVLIMLFVRDELSYDTHWRDAERIVQMNTGFSMPGTAPSVSARVSGRAKEALSVYFADDMEAITRINRLRTVVQRDGTVHSDTVHWADPGLLDVFDLTPIAGDLRAALSDNASLAVSESFARKYFGDAVPIGEVLTLTVYDLQRDYRVAAVFEDLPHSTTLEFQALAMIDEGDFAAQSWEFADWFSANGWTYIKLREGVSVEAFNAQLKTFVDSNIAVPSWLSTEPGVTASDFMNYVVQSLTEVQLDAIGTGLMKPGGAQQKVMAFASIAGLILLVACINFINLSTARATQRAREVALRKVLGANRRQLMTQFLGETSLMVFGALILGLVLVELVLPTFGGLLDKRLALDFFDGDMLIALAGLTVMIGVLAGTYPALVLSGFLPARVLKANKSAETKGSSRLRYGLVVFQFAVSIGLIVATGVTFGQMYYASNMDLGYNKDGLISVLNVGRKDAAPVRETLRQQIAQLPGVTSVGGVLSWPGGNASINRTMRVPGGQSDNVSIGLQEIDYDFIRTYEVPLLAGRNYDRSRSSDGMPPRDALSGGSVPEGSVILNRLAVAELGLGSVQEAVGRRIRIERGRAEDGSQLYADLRIVGVVGDMLFHRPRGERIAEAYYLENSNARSLSVRFEGDPQQLVQQIAGLWQSHAPAVPFQYEFVEDVIADKFTTERHLAALLGTFAALTIFVACFGLYGLASFTAERRTKEIGVRKVLGATVADIVRLLVWQFSKPVLLANLIAWPVAIWSMMRWLETYPYRMDFWYLVPLCILASMTTLAVAWVTVGSNAARVARTNPIKALRYE